MKKRIDALRRKEKRLIVGIETGSAPGKLGAALVEISGNGNETVLYLRGFTVRSLNEDLQTAIVAIERDEKFDSEELAGINFLVLRHLSKLYEDVLESAGVAPDEVDCIGLNCLEAGHLAFPGDPAVFSELTNCVVASNFRIGADNGDGGFVAVEQALLQGIVSDMIDRFGLDEEVREAVSIALLANESIFNAGVSVCEGELQGKGGVAKSLKEGKRKAVPAAPGKPCLCGEFFFPG
ncbi:MAG: hypothetical protein PHD74_00625 [Candidatus Krumholzibacteria bacterium]|nr:hypothetical protein [Candidatus Krumholzibacteria bacterium]